MMYELATAPVSSSAKSVQPPCFRRPIRHPALNLSHVNQVPFLLGMPSEDDLSPFEQDARAASVLCAMTGVLREGCA